MSSTGGGQSVYRRLFSLFPEIRFTYLRLKEGENFARPPNVDAIPCAPRFDPHHNVTADNEQWIHSFAASERIAESIGNRSFDVLEIPDYHSALAMLPAALKRHHAQIGKVVVSLHGQCSRSTLLSWDNSASTRRQGELDATLERLLYAAADIRYGISRSNLDDWKATSALTNCYLNPLSFLAPPRPTLAAASSTRPNLYFIGRTERRKGPDLFLELLWNLPRAAYSQAWIVGDAVPHAKGRDSQDSNSLLQEMADARNLDVSIRSAITQQELADVFAGRSVVFVPSRYDTLNLIALESLFAGCPTVIGDGAGVGRLLNDEFPTVPWTQFDLTDPVLNAERVGDLLDNYDSVRKNLVTELSARSWPTSKPDLVGIYQTNPDVSDEARVEIQQQYDKQMTQHLQSKPGPIRALARYGVSRVPPSRVAQWLKRKQMTWFVASYHFRHTRRIAQLSESTPEERRHKIAQLEACVGGERFGRAAIWSMLSRLEAANGRDLVAATYSLRTMRLAGQSPPGLLAATTATLRKHKFEQEATLVELMYGSPDPVRRHTGLLEWLHDHRARQMTNPTTEFVKVDDRRGSTVPRVAIIVSLYNAASKITHFLNSMSRQTMVRRGEVELILVDSGSPADEYTPIAAHPCFTGTPAIYVRTGNRETIQQAWNRGLDLARAEYVAMLGADETIRPECLDLLAAELDRRPDLDWIQSNSLVTETDLTGNFDRDLMLYDRQGYRTELVRLETCYLSWVGALYRRNIHSRFGYYDPTFGAAGDTEFKNRLLPLVKTDAYLKTLGVFWNYPEIRTTQHPRAEIEDYRAWHVFRTSAGVEYAHANTDPCEIVQAAGDALNYRRSYAKSISTDLEYACELLRYATRRDPSCFPATLLNGMNQALDDFRILDRADWSNQASVAWDARRIFSHLAKLNIQLDQIFPNHPRLTYFNDERCEHINWCWSYLT